MHIYNVGYGTREESDYFQLCHKQKFSKGEFELIVAAAVTKVLKGMKPKERRKATFQKILYSVVDGLTKEGFTRVKFDAEFDVFGWAEILDEKDWAIDRDEQLNFLTKTVSKELKKK
jgi:hypothetical protein